MGTTTDRLERRIADDLGACCAGDVDRRLDELSTLRDRATSPDPSRDTTALSVLGDGTRYTLARTLREAGGELCVCELAPLVDVGESAVSHALSDLTDAGLLTRRKEGRWRHYATTDRADALLDALDATREAR
jgi:DNA-binding transcriptional ArsR family regulator